MDKIGSPLIATSYTAVRGDPALPGQTVGV